MAVSARAVLGIDAAWTDKNPSGVALAGEVDGQWHLVAAESSAAEFVAVAGNHADTPSKGHEALDPETLLSSATKLCGIPPDIVAIDIPLSLGPIKERRPADNEVSKAYGGNRKCGTHSPSPNRPGAVGERIQKGFEGAGYQLCVTEIFTPGLIEVYPHPALLEMTGAKERLKYKVDKSRSYWKNCNASCRQDRLMEVWEGVAATLEQQIAGTTERLAQKTGASRRDLKSREDLIDAIVCCAVAVAALEGNVKPHGGAADAIWIPTPRTGASGPSPFERPAEPL